MAKKGLDTTFLHYGIRKEDMSLIETLCIEHKLEFEWVKEDLLKELQLLRDVFVSNGYPRKLVDRTINNS